VGIIIPGGGFSPTRRGSSPSAPMAERTWAARSYDFDGVNDYVTAAGAAPTIDWDGSSTWSVSVWFKNGGATSSPLYIWSACASVAATNRYMGISTFNSGGVGYVRFYGLQPTGLVLADGSPLGGAGRLDVRSTDPNGIDPADGAWHNVTLTVDTAASTAQGLKMYLDGALAGHASSGTVTKDWVHFAFGCRIQTNGTVRDLFFPGLIHQASIYNTELSAAQVAVVYNGGKAVNEAATSPAATHLYRFGSTDNMFPTLVDYSATPQNGTAENMTASQQVEDAP
jgi:hypothetical protein